MVRVGLIVGVVMVVPITILPGPIDSVRASKVGTDASIPTQPP